MSLEDKKRLAAEQERNIRMRSQPGVLKPIESSTKSAGLNASLNRSGSNGSRNCNAPGRLPGTLTPTSTETLKNMPVDLSEFFPSPSTSFPATVSSCMSTNASMNYSTWMSPKLTSPSTSVFDVPSAVEQNLSNSLNFGGVRASVTLPQPPQSLNPVLRGCTPSLKGLPLNVSGFSPVNNRGQKKVVSPLDSLLSFPPHQPSSKISAGYRPSLSPVNQQNLMSKKDPFADLLS
ncbi:hypothetical protein AB6A40_004590 [Gnathostoma spinigerum]|uniref:Uncharacterized protein n=1 Tax=Gnathostoma spinigerum TaxID=75299 RepID=A0ABD6EF80_9BILA